MVLGADTPSRVRVGTEHDAPRSWARRTVEALACRVLGEPLRDDLRVFAKATFGTLALYAAQARGVLTPPPTLEGCMLEELSSHGTGDFPFFVNDFARTVILGRYRRLQPTYQLVAERHDVSDFRATTIARPADAPSLLAQNEHGEYRYGTLADRGETVTAASYGRIVNLSRHLLVNAANNADSFDLIARMLLGVADRIADFENALFFQNCILPAAGLGPDLADGTAVYDAAHANVASGGALSAAVLSSGGSLLRAQTSPDGLTLNSPLGTLLVPAASEMVAQELVTKLTPSGSTPIRVLADAQLTGTRWYGLAPLAAGSNYIWGRTTVDPDPRTATRTGFDVDGIELRVAVDYHCGAVDHRFGTTGAGA